DGGSLEIRQSLSQFEAIGFGLPLPLSAQNKENVVTVIEAAAKLLPKDTPSTIPVAQLEVAIVGRRNSGKSTFVNAIAGQERVIVSETPGPTRHPVDLWDGHG